MTYKTIPQLKAGDIVHFNGSRFLIREDAHEDQLYRPAAGHLETAAGPSEIARAVGDWLDGEFRGFNGLERYWNFIGCNSGAKYRTEKFNPQHSHIAA